MRIDAVPGLSVGISIKAEEDLLEYCDAEDDSDDQSNAKSAESYVQCVSGAQFAINVVFGEGFRYSKESIEISVYLDGTYVHGIVCGPKSLWTAKTERISSVPRRLKHGQWVRESFTFADLATNDESVKASQPRSDLKDLGTIRVTFVRCVDRGDVESGTRPEFRSIVSDGINEKALKGRAISHSASLGKATPSEVVRTVRTDRPYGDEPFATFVFKYRSRAALQIEGLIERDPTPVPLEERDPSDLSPEEAREMVRRLRAQQGLQGRIKHEKRERTAVEIEDDPDDHVAISEQPLPKRPRTSGDPVVEVIDLTED